MLENSLDSVLVELGDFGFFQKYVFGLYCFAVILHSGAHVAFVFTSKNLSYRCRIADCDSPENPKFYPNWLKNAVPFGGNEPKQCERFAVANNSADKCSFGYFDRRIRESCEDYVYETEEITILKDFNGLNCEENLWKLTLIGTINGLGQIFGAPLAGWISDNYGRRTSIVLGMVTYSLAGIARAFTTTYFWFALFEFLDAGLGAGIYSCGFVIGAELVSPKKRVLVGSLVSISYASGEIYVAASAWLTQNWRHTILLVYIPPLFTILYLWITPESIRWLLTKGRTEEALAILDQASKMNGKPIQEESLKKLERYHEENVPESRSNISEAFKSCTMATRFFCCGFCWLSCSFLYYGITLNSVSLDGNPHLDFILIALVEIPACFVTYCVADKFGRRFSQFGALLLTSCACFAAVFIGKDENVLRLCLYLLGKFGATMAFAIAYIISTEVFPTCLRHRLMVGCYMFSRVGSMISPQTPLLEQIWAPLPLVLFGTMGIISGILSLMLPETLNVALPNTIDEAISISNSRSERKVAEN